MRAGIGVGCGREGTSSVCASGIEAAAVVRQFYSLKGVICFSRGRKPAVHKLSKRRAAERRQLVRKDVFALISHARPVEKGYKFLIKRPFAMMLCLISDVMSYRRDLGWAHADCGVSVLPCKFGRIRFHETGGICFQVPNNFDQVHTGGNRNQHVYMIVRAADCDNFESPVPCDTAHVSPERL